MKLEVESVKGQDGTYKVNLEKEGSMYHGENFVYSAHDLLSLLENIFLYEM